jgi:ribose 5-phosphate isomerase RpiB
MSNQIKAEDRGILVCGSGIGIGIAANKAGLKCSTAFNEYTAR